MSACMPRVCVCISESTRMNFTSVRVYVCLPLKNRRYFSLLKNRAHTHARTIHAKRIGERKIKSDKQRRK